MRIFVSSSFEDLSEHRAAAIRVLRQLGHEVIAMEDMIAGPAAPLTKVIEMVDRSEAYVGLFAWRYGFIPGSAVARSRDGSVGRMRPRAGARAPGIPVVKGASFGDTSITHYEYLRAKQRGLPILAFLLDERVPVAPSFVDGFDSSRPGALANTSLIRALREELQTEKVVSWFSTPSDLEARVAAAITSVGLSRQIDVKSAASVGAGAGDQSLLDSAGFSITNWLTTVKPTQHVVKIDLGDTWWSTRLFLVAALAEQLTQIRRILIVRRSDALPQSAAGFHRTAFVGQLSTKSAMKTIMPMTPALGRFQEWMRKNPPKQDDDLVVTGRRYVTEGWASAFGTRTDPHENERKVKVDLSADRLRQWFGDAMLQQPVEIADLTRASVVDLMRLLDYPNDFVPVLCDRVPDLDEPTGDVEVIEKSALSARLAHSYLTELKERARIL
ncbi:MAG: hypothetical protein QOJ08_1793 [Ilumatobacteraceae bacterium]